MTSTPPFRTIKRLLIANRGEIATRILSTARELSIETYTLYTSSDTSHTLHSTSAIRLTSPSSYLNITELISIIKKHSIDAVHPGYGFLSESAEFARRVWKEAHAVVIGPGWEVLDKTGNKLQARQLAQACDVPVLPALTHSTEEVETLKEFANDVGYPIIIKAVDGGGGRGIRIVREQGEMEKLARLALKESPSGRAFAEKAAIGGWRHVEVQIVGDGRGNVRHLWERECSIQRRFQKVVEFAPSSVSDRSLIAEVINSALRMAKSINYLSLGTFEFLVKPLPREFYFLEVNPRLQVEHTITESISMGVDLVKMQLSLAQGESLEKVFPKGLKREPETSPPMFSLQLRVTAEDVGNNWSLSIGKIKSFRFPSGNGIRVDTHLLPSQPTVIGTDFDSLIAKIIVTAPRWDDVVRKAKRALEDTYIDGVKTNLDVLKGIIGSEDFAKQSCETQWLETNLSSILNSGKEPFIKISTASQLLSREVSPSSPVAAASNVLFRKGDAWSIDLTPESSSGPQTPGPMLAHLQFTKVLRNDFPASLTASILCTTPASKEPQPFLMTVAATTASFGSIASAATHRRGDVGNQNHITLPFAGKLVELLVDKGDELKKGDTVAVVRQMKMELEIRASRGGRVVWVYEGDEGDDVGEGVLVAEIESGTCARL
ncbi:carboxylase:pyruvate/acetyl-coa/propionyl-CoA [Tricladium varicosporioides]|nr:carboxylase:pyruvate/acetyl-coa/propionyl-CoA [Hymenoscyphus varicosporioides]